ncbi:MAG TPA: PepSY domain-containing protein [Candidatus Angelobacter sp.]|nr:PepSY domain-containing protein [Candidatus Angelobacter sp.]
MSRMNVVIGLALAAVLSAGAADAKPGVHAKISMKKARATALAKVPGGKVQAEELEREHGKLIYSFDIKAPGKSGIEEVQVDAIHGGIVSMTHETPKAERKEAQGEKR